MNCRDEHENGPPMLRGIARVERATASTLRFPGAIEYLPGAGCVDTGSFVDMHPNHVTPTTMTNTKLTRPVEQYPGEAERMIDTWTRNAIAAIERARDATTGPRLISGLEEAAHAIGEALRWGKP